MKDKLSDCLNLLERCRDAVDAGHWDRLAELEQDYMTAFGRLEIDVSNVASISEKDVLFMRKLEQEQRQLVRLTRRKQQVVRSQLGILNDAQNRLQRTKHFSQRIAMV